MGSCRSPIAADSAANSTRSMSLMRSDDFPFCRDHGFEDSKALLDNHPLIAAAASVSLSYRPRGQTHDRRREARYRRHDR